MSDSKHAAAATLAVYVLERMPSAVPAIGPHNHDQAMAQIKVAFDQCMRIVEGRSLKNDPDKIPLNTL